MNELENIFNNVKVNPYESYGFLKDPFPTNAQESYKICYNQDNVKKIFIQKLKSFISNQKIETLLIDAEHRVGKTNFLLHYYHELNDIFLEKGDDFKNIYLREYGDNYLVLHKAFIETLGENFVIELLTKLKDNKKVLDEISDTDFKKGLDSCMNSPSLYGFDSKKVTIFYEWLGGIKCTQKKLNEINIFSNITTSSLAIRYFKDFIKMSRKLGIIKGLIIFLDEFELIFGESITRAKRDKYLQDIRSFIDEIQVGSFVVCAITPYALVNLSQDYQALKARFGESISLSPIRNSDEAIAYANQYIEFARSEFKNKNKGNRKKIKRIIEESDIKDIYNKLAMYDEDLDYFYEEIVDIEFDVKQGYFFERLHNFVEDKINDSSVIASN